MIRVVVALLLGLGLASGAGTPEVASCVCGEPQTPEEQIGSNLEIADTILLGRVVQVEDPLPSVRSACREQAPAGHERLCDARVVTFRVQRAWRGVDQPRITLLTGGDLCGYDFERGRRYLVYASQRAWERAPRATLCMRIQRASESRVDQELLGAPSYVPHEGA